MAKTTADLWFRFFADTKSLDKGTSRARTDLSKTEKAAAGVSRGFTGMQKAFGAVGLALGAREVFEWTVEAGKMAETANIAAESADKALGPAAQRLRDDFSDLRRTMGFNQGEFDQLIAKQGLLVTGLGASQEGAGELIGELITLGGDLATFSGNVGDTERAIDAVTAAVRGEFDPLEQWGVKLSAAKIAAEKARLAGIDPMFASLDDGEQTLQAIISLIEQGAAPAIGSLGDAAETAAGQSNELTTRLEDMQAELGQHVTPMLIKATGGANSFFRGLENLSDGTTTWTRQLGFFAEGLGIGVRQITDFFHRLALGLPVLGSVARFMDNARHQIWRFVQQIRQIPSKITNPFSSWRMPNLKIPGFATGGMVPGPKGAPQLAVVHGGERVQTPAQQRNDDGGGGGGVTINIDASLSDPQAIAGRIVDLLRIYNRTQGGIPIVIEGGIG